MVFLPICELSIGLTFKRLRGEVPWVYKAYDHPIRQIAAGSWGYFLAWFGIGVGYYALLDLFLI